MRGIAEIRHLIAHAGSQRKTAAIAQFSVKLALQHIEHVAAITPVIGEIACRVLDHADADVANVERAPDRLTALTGMRRRCDLAPVGDREGQGWNLHWQYPGKRGARGGPYRLARQCHDFLIGTSRALSHQASWQHLFLIMQGANPFAIVSPK